MAKNDNSKGGKAAGGKCGKGGPGKGAPGKGAPGKGGGAKGGPPAKGGAAKAAKGEKRQALVQKDHAGAGLPTPAPRLKQYYDATVRERLAKQFGFTNPHQVPGLEKVVLNCGVGEAINQPRVLDNVVDEMALISGQRPVRRKAK